MSSSGLEKAEKEEEEEELVDLNMEVSLEVARRLGERSWIYLLRGSRPTAKYGLRKIGFLKEALSRKS